MKRLIIGLAVILNLLVPVALPRFVYADCPANPSTPKEQVQSGLGTAGGNCSGAGVTNVISTVIQILSIIVGIAAVIMIIFSGFRYITSGGDANKVSGAKSALIYALIGLVVVALSQFLVHFVLTQGVASTTECAQGQHVDPNDATKCVDDKKKP